MKSIAIVLILLFIALPAQAQRTMEVLASPTMFDGESGHAFRIDTPGDGIEEFFFIENANGLVEFHGWRVPPAPFESLGGFQYLVPITTGDVTPGMSFWFIEDCDLALTTYMGMVEVTVPAGTFMTYQFNIEDSCEAGWVEVMYWANDIGLVQQRYYDNLGNFVDGWDLNSYTINGGSGLFPRAAGNLWEFTEGSVDTRDASIGTLKTRFTD